MCVFQYNTITRSMVSSIFTFIILFVDQRLVNTQLASSTLLPPASSPGPAKLSDEGRLRQLKREMRQIKLDKAEAMKKRKLEAAAKSSATSSATSSTLGASPGLDLKLGSSSLMSASNLQGGKCEYFCLPWKKWSV